MTSSREEDVGIVGAGTLGKAIASHFCRCGMRSVICNSRAPATLDPIVHLLGPNIRAGAFEEAVAPEIVVLALPWVRVPAMLERVSDWEGRIIIDATNPWCSRDVSTPEPDDRPSGERIVKLAPGAHVVMAFNAPSATVLEQSPAEAGGRRVIFYSGDHVRAKRKVATLISGLGFAPVDLGPLAVGGRLLQSPDSALATLNFVQLPATSPARM